MPYRLDKNVALHDLVCAANLEANLEKDLDAQVPKESTTIGRHSHPKASHVGPLLNSFLFSVAKVAAPAAIQNYYFRLKWRCN